MMSIQEFFTERLPAGWFEGPAAVEVDDDEILCTGTLPAGASVEEFRERTRAQRMEVASEAERRFGRHVAWGVRDGERTVLFTSMSVPVMTRLRLRERSVLDTLVRGGVARSRSDALA